MKTDKHCDKISRHCALQMIKMRLFAHILSWTYFWRSLRLNCKHIKLEAHVHLKFNSNTKHNLPVNHQQCFWVENSQPKFESMGERVVKGKFWWIFSTNISNEVFFISWEQKIECERERLRKKNHFPVSKHIHFDAANMKINESTFMFDTWKVCGISTECEWDVLYEKP